MVCKFRVYALLIVGSVFMCTLVAADQQYQEHGWARLDTVRNKTPHSMLFYAESRGLMSMLPEGSVVRIKALKTGFGMYYKAEKNASGAWILKASAKDAKDPASQFLVSYVGNSIVLASEFAKDGNNGLLLASSGPTFDVTLINDKVVKSDKTKANTVLWDLVEDEKAGDTLETCYLKNRATGGTLTASYDSSGGSTEGEIARLNQEIKTLEANTPYLEITAADTEGAYGDYSRDLARNIKDEVVKRIHADNDGLNSVLDIPAGDWVAEWSGISMSRMKAARFWTRVKHMNDPRSVRIKYKEGDGVEKEKVFDQIEGKALYLKADVTKHPAWKLRQQVKNLQISNIGMQSLKSSDVARTGYVTPSLTTIFKPEQWSKIAIETVSDVGDYDDQGAEKQTIAGGSSQNLFIWAHKRPEFTGFGEQKITDFGSEMVVTMKPLYSKGFVWIEESLPTPGEGTISFRAVADEGDVQVCFSDSVKPYTIYRIVFGAAGNTKTIIYKNNVPVQEISNEQNENARLSPGMIEKLWVSLNHGFIIVGKGDPGAIVLMAWQDPDPAKGIERVGFSTFKSNVKYTDVQKLSDPIVIVPPKLPYATDTKSIQVGSKESPAWHQFALSPSDAGTIVFEATGSEEANLVLSDDDGEGYIISFGADGNTCTKIVDLKEGGELYGVYATAVPDKPSAVTEPLETEVKPVTEKELATENAGEKVVEKTSSVQDVVQSSSDKTTDTKAVAAPVTGTASPSTAVASVSGVTTQTVPDSKTSTKQTVAASASATKTTTALVPSKKTSSLSSFAILDKNKPNKFWVSYYKGRIILGKGEIGKNPFCIYVDAGAPKGISKIGFSGKAAIQNLEIWPEVDLGFEEEPTDYVKQREFSEFKGALNIISPYDYSIYQEGPTVVFKDKLTGMQWKMAGTPSPEAKYSFMVDVENDGTPNIKLLFQDPSAEIVKVQGLVTMFESQKDASMRISQNLAYATGPDMVSSLVAIAASSVAGAAGAGWAAGQAAAQTKLSELQELANRYIYTEQIDQQQKGQAEIKSDAQRNRQTLESKLEAILQLQLQDAAQLDYATKQWDDVLRLVTDFYVVDDSSVKRKLADGLKEAYDAVKSLDLTTVSLPIYNRMINCLMKAYNNAYLTKAGNAEDDARKRDWYLWINTLSRTLFNSPALMSLGIDINFKGEYLWFPVAFPQAGKGSVTFEAKAYSNIFVAFSENPYQVRNRSSRMYEIVIGKWDNKTTAIHRKSLGDAVIEFEHAKIPELSPDPTDFKKYWINFDNGKISGGIGALGQNKLWEWTDPYPAAPVKWVGFSNWLSVNTYRNIKVGYPFIAGSGFKPVASEVTSEVETPVASAEVKAKPVVKPAAKKTATKPAVKKTTGKGKPAAKKTTGKKSTTK